MIHHVSIRTRDLTVVENFYGVLGFVPEVRFMMGPQPAVWLTGPHGRIELIETTDLPVEPAQLESTRLGYYHLALQVTQLDELLEQLRESGARDVQTPAVRSLSGQHYRVVFLRDPEGVLVELIERVQLS